MSEELRPCPRGTKAELHEDIKMSGKGQFWVQAVSGWVGPVKSEPDDAVSAWNTRANTDPMTIAKGQHPSREAIAEIICKNRAVDNWEAMPCDYELADAILEAFPAPVSVKPLPWRNSYGITRADTEAGTWFLKGKIAEFSKQPFSMVVGDDPQADVQAKHEQIVRSLIDAPEHPAEQPVSVRVAAREAVVDEIEEIISETHDIDVQDRNYAENIVSWMELHHPAALRALADQPEGDR